MPLESARRPRDRPNPEHGLRLEKHWEHRFTRELLLLILSVNHFRAVYTDQNVLNRRFDLLVIQIKLEYLILMLVFLRLSHVLQEAIQVQLRSGRGVNRNLKTNIILLLVLELNDHVLRLPFHE